MNGLLAIGNIVERQTDITIKELDEGAKKFKVIRAKRNQRTCTGTV